MQLESWTKSITEIMKTVAPLLSLLAGSLGSASGFSWSLNRAEQPLPSDYPTYQTKIFQSKLDHFDYNDNRTWPHRYLYR